MADLGLQRQMDEALHLAEGIITRAEDGGRQLGTECAAHRSTLWCSRGVGGALDEFGQAGSDAGTEPELFTFASEDDLVVLVVEQRAGGGSALEQGGVVFGGDAEEPHHDGVRVVPGGGTTSTDAVQPDDVRKGDAVERVACRLQGTPQPVAAQSPIYATGRQVPRSDTLEHLPQPFGFGLDEDTRKALLEDARAV